MDWVNHGSNIQNIKILPSNPSFFHSFLFNSFFFLFLSFFFHSFYFYPSFIYLFFDLFSSFFSLHIFLFFYLFFLFFYKELDGKIMRTFALLNQPTNRHNYYAVLFHLFVHLLLSSFLPIWISCMRIYEQFLYLFMNILSI